MRDYTRKAKRVDNGEWIIGYLVSCDERYFIAEVPECDTCKYMYEGYWFGTFYEVDPDTICNPTGLTDKNGNKIWENDIVKCYAVDICDREYEFVSDVFWDDCMWMVHEEKYSDGMLCHFDMSKNWLSHIPEIEAIGNIFDNADLLKGE